MAPVHVPDGSIGLVIAKIGAPPPPDGRLARHVESDHFQDSQRFLAGGGWRGPQLEVLTGGSYDIDPEMFDVVAYEREVEIPPGDVGVVKVLVGAKPGRKREPLGRVVSGHDSFQRPWEFLWRKGQRGIQKETLAGGRRYAINPWFARVTRVPTGLILEWPMYVDDHVRYILRGNLLAAIHIPADVAPRLVQRFAMLNAWGRQFDVARHLELLLAPAISEYLGRLSKKLTFKEFAADYPAVRSGLTLHLERAAKPLGIRMVTVLLEKPELNDPEIDQLRGELAALRENLLSDEESDEFFVADTLGMTAVLTETAEVTIYLSDAGAAGRVEQAVEGFLALAGAEVVGRDDPILGSWFRRLHAKVGRDAMTSAAHAIDTRFVLGPDAAVAKDLMSGLAPMIGALGSVEEAVIRVGALLIVKIDGRLVVSQLTARQQLELDHNPNLAASPQEILRALQLGVNGSPRPIAELDEGAPGGDGEAEGGTRDVL